MEIKKRYSIDSKVFLPDGRVISGRAKIKGCLSEIHAKVKLGEILTAKYPDHIKIEMSEPELLPPEFSSDAEQLQHLKDIMGIKDEDDPLNIFNGFR